MASQDQGIYSFEECVPEGSDYLQKTLGRAHIRWTLVHNKRKRRWEQLNIKLSRFKNIPQAMRNMKRSILEEPLIHLEHFDKKWWSHEWRIWWSGRIKKDSTHETNKYKYSIVISWYCFCYAFVYIQVDVLCMIECLH